MTLWDVMELSEYWAENPPVHLLVAAFVGYKSEAPPRFRPEDFAETNDNWRQQLAAIPGGEVGSLPANLPAPIFDGEALMRIVPN
jgi:hypothetical protein